MLPKDIFLQCCYLSRSHPLQNSSGLALLNIYKDIPSFFYYLRIAKLTKVRNFPFYATMHFSFVSIVQMLQIPALPHSKKKKASEKKPLAYAVKLFFFFYRDSMYIYNLCSSALVSLSRGWGWKRLDMTSNFSTLSRQLESWELIISRLVKGEIFMINL